MLLIVDDFIESVVTAACQLARHRKSSTLECEKDVQLHLERQWNMWIPGFGSEELTLPKSLHHRSSQTENGVDPENNQE